MISNLIRECYLSTDEFYYELDISNPSNVCIDICKSQCCKKLTQKETSISLRASEIQKFVNKGLEEFIIRESDEVILHRKTDGSCPFLKDSGECGIYNIRPLDCQEFPYGLETIEQVENIAKCLLYYNTTTDKREKTISQIRQNLTINDEARVAGQKLGQQRIDPSKFSQKLLRMNHGLVVLYIPNNRSFSSEMKKKFVSVIKQRRKDANFLGISFRSIDSDLNLEFLANGYYYRRDYYEKITKVDPPDNLLDIVHMSNTHQTKIARFELLKDIDTMIEYGAFLHKITEINIQMYNDPKSKAVINELISQTFGFSNDLPSPEESRLDLLDILISINKKLVANRDKIRFVDGVLFQFDSSILNSSP